MVEQPLLCCLFSLAFCFHVFVSKAKIVFALLWREECISRKEIMDYKKHYTNEELDELISWFDSHKEHLPKSLQMDKATYIKDLDKTLKLYLEIEKRHKDNDTYGGQIYHMFMMRDAIRALWKKENKDYE